MSDKKNHSIPEEVEGTPVEEMQAAQDNEGGRADLAVLMKELEAAKSKAAENLDGWQRAQAEFVNYRNRMQRDQELMRSNMKGDILRRIVPVLDDMERALSNRPAGDAWADGLELIVRKFQSILESEGLTRIPAEGQPFDPNFHEAVSHEPNNEVESGHVIAVVQNGYMLGERVVRPAMVRVAQ
jgi:molecular chaperone GrpE